MRISKKGDAPDTIVFVLSSLILAVALVLIIVFMGNFATKVSQNPDLNSTAVGRQGVVTLNDIGGGLLQKLFVLVFAFQILGILVTSFFIRAHPIFAILYFILIGFAVLEAVFADNLFERFTDVSSIAAYSSSYAMISFIMSNMRIIVAAVGLISLVFIFAKPGSSGSGGLPI